MEENMSESESEGENQLNQDNNSQCYTVEEIAAACQEEGVQISNFQADFHKKRDPEIKMMKERGSHCQNELHKDVEPKPRWSADPEPSKTVDPEPIANPKLSKNAEPQPSKDAETEPSKNSFSPDKDAVTAEQCGILPQDMGASNQGKEKCRKSTKYESENRKINRIKRMRGESYQGFSTVKDPETGRKNTPQNVLRKSRKLGPTCKSTLCFKTKKRHCNVFSEEARNLIFNEFWQDLDWEPKKAFVRSLVDRTIPVTSGKSKRQETFKFYLKLDGTRRRVCRQMFLSTLGLGKDQLRSWLTRPRVIAKKKPVSVKGGDLTYAKKFLNKIPKLESHYCRKDTSMLYLEPIFRTKYQLFQKYKERCTYKNTKRDKINRIVPVSRTTFLKLADMMRIGIHQPKKDRCDLCSARDAGNADDSEIQRHKQKKALAREEKQRDKEAALRGEVHVIAMDVQKVLMSPMLNASALYYKTKLIVHNFTVFDLASLHACCYLWDESESDLVASSFATCVIKYMEDNFRDQLPVVIFSDGCTSQNRNAILANALSHYAIKHGKTVIQKYLEKGHTQMEVDSVHAQIEKQLKGKEIHLPTDYIDVCKNARRNPQPYDVVYMKNQDFLDYSVNKLYKSIRPKKQDDWQPNVTDLRQIRYNLDGTIDYKVDHADEWSTLPKTGNVIPNLTFPKLHDNRLSISKRKHDDLLGLLHVIPKTCHDFYVSIPYKK